MRSQILKNSRVLIAALMIAPLTGCAALQNCKYELNQRAYTAMAWSDFDADKKFCVVSSHSADFKRGWKAGFYSVITGGECRPPVIPPKTYWEPPLLFSCNECGCKDWYAGFRCGADAARHQPDHHYIKPWFSTACESCDSCQMGSTEFATPHSIRLLGIEPIASPGIEFTDSIEPQGSSNESDESDLSSPEDSSASSAERPIPPKAQPTAEDVPPPPPKSAFDYKELTLQPSPRSLPRMEK